MQDLVKVPVRGYTEYMGYKIPNDYSQTELWDIVLVQYGDMKRVEFEWVHREFVQSHGKEKLFYFLFKLNIAIFWILNSGVFLFLFFFYFILCLLLQDIHLRPMNSLNCMKNASRPVLIYTLLNTTRNEYQILHNIFTMMLIKAEFHPLIFVCRKTPQTRWQITEKERWNWKAPWKRTTNIEGGAKRE